MCKIKTCLQFLSECASDHCGASIGGKAVPRSRSGNAQRTFNLSRERATSISLLMADRSADCDMRCRLCVCLRNYFARATNLVNIWVFKMVTSFSSRSRQSDNDSRNWYKRCNNIVVSCEFILIRRTCDYI